jgi:hypothetical protein
MIYKILNIGIRGIILFKLILTVLSQNIMAQKKLLVFEKPAEDKLSKKVLNIYNKQKTKKIP